MTETEILIKLEKFDGPLALLLHLVQKQEVSIRDLDITKITAQYLDYLQRMQDLNFDVAGEFLFMAATLLYLKSQTAVSEGEDPDKIAATELGLEITSRGELIKRLEELARFQKLGEKLWSLPRKGEDIFVKPKVDKKAIENSILTPIDLAELTGVMMDLIRREKKKYTVVKRDRISIKEKLIKLKSLLKIGERQEFTQLLDKSDTTIVDRVITFISLLELARLKKLNISQDQPMGSIFVDLKEELDSFDVDTADGFDPEGEEAVHPLAEEQIENQDTLQ